MRRANNWTGGISANTNKLHEKVAWFYRRLAIEYDCPTLPQFLQETIPTAFRSHGALKIGNASIGSDNENHSRNESKSPKRTYTKTGGNDKTIDAS